MAECENCIHFKLCEFKCEETWDRDLMDANVCSLYTAVGDVAPKSEVARGIFAEIEKIIDKHHSECYEYEDGDECDTAITYISYISCDIAELKKKYTEGQ